MLGLWLIRLEDDSDFPLFFEQKSLSQSSHFFGILGLSLFDVGSILNIFQNISLEISSPGDQLIKETIT